MSKMILVGYDGSVSSRRAVDFAVDRAAARGEGVRIVHVLEWSPYSFLTPSELEERHKRRTEEMARAQTAILDPLAEALAGASVPVETAIKYGNAAETLAKMAEADDVSLLMVARDGKSRMGARVFGSVAATLSQIAPVPVTIVP